MGRKLAPDAVSGYRFHVTYRGTVKDGVVILPPEARLPDGTTAEVTPLTVSNDPPFLQELLKLAKDRDWAPDFALNHSHYAKRPG